MNQDVEANDYKLTVPMATSPPSSFDTHQIQGSVNSDRKRRFSMTSVASCETLGAEEASDTESECTDSEEPLQDDGINLSSVSAASPSSSIR
jgi:hypothetical protein